MPIRYERVTEADGARELYRVEEASVPFDHPGLLPDPVDDFLGMLPDGTPSERVEFELIFDGEDVVGNTFVMLPLKDNTHTANANVTVKPAARRQGIGRHAAIRLVDRIRAEGRKVVVTFVGAPIGTSAPGDGLAASLGAIAALESIRRALGVRDVDDVMLHSLLERGVGDHAKDYDVVQWLDHAPEELVDRAAAILPLVFSDSPRGELDFEDEVWDAERFREYETTVQDRRRHLLVTGAVDRATGRLVAYTDITVPMSNRELASQWGTIVEREHRGHRLGMLVKVENLRNLRRHFPETETITTWNAAENRHMIAVNEELGFRAVERYQAWQLTL